MAAPSNISNPEISLTATPPPAMISSASSKNNSNSGVSVSNQSRRAGAKAAVSSPWTQIVRGESEPVVSVSLSSTAPAATQVSAGVVEQLAAATEGEGVEYGSGNAGKKPAWNKPSNGAGAAAAAEAPPVMGAHLWPALSETATRGGSSTKSSSDSLKGLAEGSSSTPSVVVSQGSGMATSLSQKQVGNNGNPNSAPTTNHTAQVRQRFTRRNTAGTSSNGGLPQPPAPQGPVVEIPHNPSPRDHSQKSGFVSQSHSGNDHPQQRNSYRNRNGGTHPRGDGSHHHNYGGKRDQDRGNQDWNAHRNYNGRDAHMQPQRVVQRFMRPPPPPPGSAPFIPPGPMRPYVSPMGFPDFGAVYYVAPPPLDALRGVPFIGPSPPHTLFFHAPDPQLQSRIVNQIDYYFSNENLIKDTYLRQNMDDQGWVAIKLIAGFNKVSLLTDSIQLILDALRSSTVVEVQGDKIRRRNDWMRWIMPQINQVDAHAETISRSSSGDLNSQLPRSSSVGTGPISIQGGSDLSGKITN
ncbi:hypothetical protein ACOSP7_022610 [Xanthoceras sorbifolium]